MSPGVTDCSFWLEKVKLNQDLCSKLRRKLHKEKGYQKTHQKRYWVNSTGGRRFSTDYELNRVLGRGTFA